MRVRVRERESVREKNVSEKERRIYTYTVPRIFDINSAVVHPYIYIYIYVCVCVCIYEHVVSLSPSLYIYLCTAYDFGK